jgi:hypothetical protein
MPYWVPPPKGCLGWFSVGMAMNAGHCMTNSWRRQIQTPVT